MAYLVAAVFLLGWPIVPISGLQDYQKIFSSNGVIMYPDHELGVFYVKESRLTIPDEAKWVVAAYPDYEKPRQDINVILDWYNVLPPTMWETGIKLKDAEQKLKNIQVEKFWGIFFICEEQFRSRIAFNDDMDITWFGERLTGYPIYQVDNPTASWDDWRDEMFLRMVRGFYNYFHGKTKIGITAPASSLIPNFRDRGEWLAGIPYSYGEPAMNFIKEHFDFVFLYNYAVNLEDFNEWFKPYFSLIDQLFSKQKKFWILTRIWDEPPPYGNIDVWEKEVIALEMKNCLDRNMVVTCYYWNNPPLEETWSLIKRTNELYDSKAPYFENYVYGENLLTGYVGDTYGWVEV